MSSGKATAACWAFTALIALPNGSATPLPEPSSAENIVATYQGGTVTLSEVTQWRLGHPETAADGPPSRDEVERIALVEHFAEAAVARGAESQPALRDLLASQAEDILVRALRREAAHQSRATVRAEDVEAAFREYPKAFQKPERRRLRTLFRRFPVAADAAQRAAVRAEIEDLRRQVVSGAAEFSDLARERSDSQNRFRDGLIGNAEAGELPPAIEAIAWKLGPGEVSEPLVSADGITLLFCEEILEAVAPAPDEVRRRLRKNLEGIAVRRDWAALEEAARQRAAGDATPGLAPQELLPSGLAAEARARGLAELPEVRARLTWKRLDTLALDELRRRVDERFTEPTEAEVKAYHAAHADRFKAPPELELLAITLALETGAERAAYQQAERLLADLRAGRMAFDEAARRFSTHPSAASSGALGWVPGPRLAQFGANVWKAAMALAPGELSEVVAQDGTLWILRLEAARPRRPGTYEEAAEAARKRLSDELLARHQKEIEDETLAELTVELLATDPPQ